MTDTIQDKDDYDSERTNRKKSEICANKEDVPQDGASLSSGKGTEEKASQNTQTSPLVQDRMYSQAHQTFSSDFPSTQGLTGNTRSEEMEHASQSFPTPPGKSSSSGPDSVKCQPTEEHVEMEENSKSSEPNPTNNFKTESPTDDFSPPRPDNELQSVQCALSDSVNQPEIKDQNDNKSTPCANQATNMVSISQTQCSTTGVLPPSADQNTKVLDTRSHGDLVKAQSENVIQQFTLPLQPLNSASVQAQKEETQTLHCTSGQGEKQQNPSNRKVFGPHNNEV